MDSIFCGAVHKFGAYEKALNEESKAFIYELRQVFAMRQTKKPPLYSKIIRQRDGQAAQQISKSQRRDPR